LADPFLSSPSLSFYINVNQLKRAKMKRKEIERPTTLKEYNESRLTPFLIVDGKAFRRMKRKGLI
jgi:hypothetical protein